MHVEDDERVRSGTPLHGRNVFPELPGYREAVLDYMSALTDDAARNLKHLPPNRVPSKLPVDH